MWAQVWRGNCHRAGWRARREYKDRLSSVGLTVGFSAVQVQVAITWLGQDMASTSDKESPKQAARRAREERLARALRDNLQRRKAQGRGRADAAVDDPPTGEPGKK